MQIDNLNDATQHATITILDRPVATVTRARINEPGPRWRVYNTNGLMIGRVWLTPKKHTLPSGVTEYDYDRLAERIRKIVAAHYKVDA